MGKWSRVKHLRLLPDCAEKRFEASKLQERSYQWHLVVSCNYSSNEPPNDSHIDSSSNTKAIKPLLSSCVFILRIIVHTWKCYNKMSIDKLTLNVLSCYDLYPDSKSFLAFLWHISGLFGVVLAKDYIFGSGLVLLWSAIINKWRDVILAEFWLVSG